MKLYHFRRAGRHGLLQPLAAQLFSHVLGFIKRWHSGRQHALLAPGAGADHAVVLRQCLLPVPAYCAAASVNDLQGAAAIVVKHIVPDSDLLGSVTYCFSRTAT
jgi:hypothetical protein